MLSWSRPLTAGIRSVLIPGGVITRKSSNTTFQEHCLNTNRTNKILQFGQPSTINVRGKRKKQKLLVYRDHVLLYDEVKKVPLWVGEHLTKEMVCGRMADMKRGKFRRDLRVLSCSNKDYRNSGFSRGHMASAGNYKHCQDSRRETFLLTNVVPQDIDNNNLFWNNLEIQCRDLVEVYNNDVWITSGPLWLPIHERETMIKDAKTENQQLKEIGGRGQPSLPKQRSSVIGPNKVYVPTHLFKIVLVPDLSLQQRFLLTAFLVPNSSVRDLSLTEYQVELDVVEHHSGMTFHPLLSRSDIGNLQIFSQDPRL